MNPPESHGDVLELLKRGDMEIEGRLIDASNATLRAFVTFEGVTVRCVYKPVRGERPLWDFPDGTLARREVAAYLVSEATGWNTVPPTVLRDGPLGTGSCQLWIETAAEALVDFTPKLPTGWRAVAAAQGGVLGHADDPGLARVAVYDTIVNNADRKGGHLLRAAERPGGRVAGRPEDEADQYAHEAANLAPVADHHIYGIDNGLCFHVQDKLRTVLWGWAGSPLPEVTIEVLDRLRVALEAELGPALAELLATAEVTAVGDRITRLLSAGRYPVPSTAWPALPWPAL